MNQIFVLLLTGYLTVGNSAEITGISLDDGTVDILGVNERKFVLDLMDNPKDPEYYRLPRRIIPETYRLRVIPFLEDENFMIFRGDVEIKVSVRESTEAIVLHARGLRITQHKVLEEAEAKAEIMVDHSFDLEERDFHVITVKEPLTVGKSYKLMINFEGRLSDDLSGFYRSSYKDASGKTQWMALTQFEPTNARKAFPCFDEPHLKANFTISVARSKEMISLSNMPAEGPPEDDSNLPVPYVWDHYKETPKMSTYLVAFIVSRFKDNDDIANGIRVWARQDAIDRTSYSLQFARDVLEVMHDLMGIKYTLPKLDMVAIPDFQGGAMENWGLVTFRETALLYQNESSTSEDQQNVASLVAHELAHQWFGNLVTPEWWKFTWMKEGFAAYFQYALVDLIEPSWRMMQQFVTQELQMAFLIDALDWPHPVSSDVRSTDDIDSMFDQITYNKGGSVIRMMEHFLSRNTFFNGLRRYLSSRHHNSGNDLQLFSALDSQAKIDKALPDGVTVNDVMVTWTNQRGYPVVTVERDYNTHVIKITQERFLLGPSGEGGSYRWWIPLTFTTRSSINFMDTKPQVWMPKSDILIANSSASKDDWIIFNVQEVGYYRVNYDPVNWELIIDYLRSSEYGNVHPVNRAQLIDDALNLARAGHLPYYTALDLTHYLDRETDYIPWSSANVALGFLDRRLAKSKEYHRFKAYIRRLLHPHLQKSRELGENSPEDRHVTQLSRSLLMRMACKYDHSACTSKATALFTSWTINRKNSIPVDFRSTAYCSGISSGGKEEWNFLWEEYKTSIEPDEQGLMLDALGCSRDKEVLRGYLQKTIDDDNYIRKHDISRVFLSICKNDEGVDVTLDFMETNFDKLKARYTDKSIGQVISFIPAVVVSKEQAEKMKQFLKDNEGQLKAAETAAKQALQTLERNVEWWSTFLTVVESWLKENYP